MVGIAREGMDIRTLVETTKREVSLYAATSDTATFYPVLDDIHQIYAVVVVENDRTVSPPWVFVMARVVGDKVIIEEDATLEKHLVDALVINGGIPREQIVLAYAGEKPPKTAEDK